MGDIITSVGSGYEFQPLDSTVDAEEFIAHMENGRVLTSEDPAAASSELHSGLALGRGHPFQDAEARSELDAEITRFNELRLVAIESQLLEHVGCHCLACLACLCPWCCARMLMATVGLDDFARVWDLNTLTLIHEIHVGGLPTAVAFAEDDTQLTDTTRHGGVRVFHLELDSILDVARDRLLRGFTENECRVYFPDRACPKMEEVLAG